MSTDITADPPSSPPGLLANRRHAWAFWVGSAVVTAGVVLHLPMYWMARNMGFHLAGMAMDPGMLWGMLLIVGGVGLAAYGLLPRTSTVDAEAHITVSPSETAPLTRAHWRLMIVLVVALVIDVMKPAALGFVVPGMVKEYAVPKSVVAWLPFCALFGTVVGSVVWGVLADVFGRRASMLLSAVMFVGTSICGAMPSLWWNVAMCFLMGAAAGGFLPVAYALLAEIMPTRHRGWSLVLVGGLGATGGYLAASGLSALLQPQFGWRIMWFLNLPTGLILIALSGLIPESARFLMSIGRTDAAKAIMRQFGSVVMTHGDADHFRDEAPVDNVSPPAGRYLALTVALSVAALSWSFVNFGLLLWLPQEMVSRGLDVGATSKLLAKSALIALPTVFVVALLYSRWSTKWSLVGSIAIMGAGALWLLLLHFGAGGAGAIVWPVAVLIVGANALLTILLPYAAENYPLQVRGRATGWVAACSKAGGLVAQGLGILAAVPPFSIAAGFILAPILLGLGLVAAFGSETRGRDLRELETGAR